MIDDTDYETKEGHISRRQRRQKYKDRRFTRKILDADERRNKRKQDRMHRRKSRK